MCSTITRSAVSSGRRVAAKNREFYRRYPHNVERIGRIADRLAESDVRLPDGDRLTVRRFQSLGIDFGMKPGYESIHWLIDEAFDSDELSDTFLGQALGLSSYLGNDLDLARSPARPDAATNRRARSRLGAVQPLPAAGRAVYGQYGS